jgi:LPS biosynthesis protein
MKKLGNTGQAITLDELKVIQMDILEVIHAFCKENGIRYSLACGTLLGAIRHKGYIPWDDDIDIYIPREDYKRFVAAYPKQLHNVRVLSLERDRKWDRAYAQAFDSRTILREVRASEGDKGVYIDIYPIDSVPDNDTEWFAFNRHRRFLVRLSEVKYVTMTKDRSFMKNLVLAVGKLLLIPFSAKTIAKWISRYAQRYNGKGYHRSFECVQGMLQKRPFDTSLLNSYIETDFEDRRFMIMEDFDAYLSNAYGDYMKLPPIEKQVSHHVFEAWWKN